MILPLVYYGDPLLRRRSAEIKEITDDIRQLALDMIETMDAAPGIGLAAPQVGRSVRLFVLRNYIDTSESEKCRWETSSPLVFINPKVQILDDKELLETEGCLSIPGIRAQVPRPFGIRIWAQDIEGKEFSEDVFGYNARVRLHENDHLNGVLFIDRISSFDRRRLSAELHLLEKKIQKK